jgi:hypothetical protein
MSRFIVTPYGELLDMDPPYMFADFMDNDLGIMRAHYRRLFREQWFRDHPEFVDESRAWLDKRSEELQKVVEQARRDKSRGAK